MFCHHTETVALVFDLPGLPKFLKWFRTEHALTRRDNDLILTMVISSMLTRNKVRVAIRTWDYDDYEYIEESSGVLYQDCQPFLEELEMSLTPQVQEHVGQLGVITNIDFGYDFIVLYIETYK